MYNTPCHVYICTSVSCYTDTTCTMLEYRYNQGMFQCLKDVWNSGTTLGQPLQQPLSWAVQGRRGGVCGYL